MTVRSHWLLVLHLALLALAFQAGPASSASPDAIRTLALKDSEDRIAALGKLLAEADGSAIPFLQALHDGEVQIAGGRQVLIVRGDTGIDAVTGAAVAPLPPDLEAVVVNNRIRREIASAIAALMLVSPDLATRRMAAKALETSAEESALPLIGKALDKETDPEIKAMLVLIWASAQLRSQDAAMRLAAVKELALSNNANTKTLLLGVLEKKGQDWAEPDAGIRSAAELSLREVESRLSTGERIGQIFTGVSLGSILLLAALGLAITYGLMGVINMAHGEFIMIGAYATYVIQNLVRSHAPEWFNWYLPAAVPVAFASAALVGMLLERTVIRFLYGRPLETLLATWGISLFLIQTVRTIFGAQNVQVENPVWMSGGVQILSNVVLPHSRIVIIGFALVVVLLVWVALMRTRLGLFVRGVTQNREIAACMGVNTARIDTWAFGLGSGIAGLAGCALSQIGNVGPDLGQSVIVDSFMVVVLGGVGQLAGTIYAALGLGVVNKFLEAWSGAVLAKIAVLVFIIIFIQKRPQGLFALKGRAADA
ncbi:MAG: urea ABC transporter permease subunit UrtB [Betaproteobacteria bacterium RIFCSPLOWO2_12_FULL_62_13b]|nr:MAG: urea ABC transporter permease subunit UrtB [Betaproteobacteria bacterium RIFCSPLOWO2_12_FULL_62_13b]